MFIVVVSSIISSVITAITVSGIYRRRLDRLTVKDSITDLYKKEHLETIYIKELHRARRSNEVLSILFLYTEESVELSRSLSRVIKRDTDYICQYDKDLYLLLLTDTDANGTDHVISRLRDLLKDREFHIGVHTGIPDNHTNSQSMLYEAMKALKRSKSQPKGIEFSLNSV